MKNNEKHIVILLFITLGGFPYFIDSVPFKILSFVYISFLFFKKRMKFDKYFLIFMVGLTIITLFQIYKFQFLPEQSIIGLYVVILIAYMTIKLLNKDFFIYFILWMVRFAIISFVFYLLGAIEAETIVFFKPIISVFKILNPTSIYESTPFFNFTFFGFHFYHGLRNPGPFWEPGVFAGYLFIAFIFNTIITNGLVNKQNKILFIAMLTTLSTTVFIALIVFLIVYAYITQKHIVSKLIIVSILIAGGGIIFTSLDFLGEKIQAQYKFAMTTDLKSTGETQRFVNILKDLNDLQGHEIVGRGSNPLTRYENNNHELDPSNNHGNIRTVGWSDLMVKFGIPMFLVTLYYVFNSLKVFLLSNQFHQSFIIFGVFVSIITLTMSEIYFNFTIFWGLVF